jgi:plastocyanin
MRRPAVRRLRILGRAAGVLATLALAAAPAGLRAQSLLDRPPNISGDWVVRPGVVQFNFLHRFTRSGAPERKISNFPTFVVAAGIIQRLNLGFQYASNSELAPRYPNEWEFFGRYALFQEDAGHPLDVAGQVGYNLAAEGVDGEVSLGKRVGPVRLLGAFRVLSDPFEEGEVRTAVGGGGAIRLHRFVSIAGDVSTLLKRDTALGERVAWSAGLHLAIPNSPHTLSLQATNTNTTTLQGLSRGSSRVRYGFEFTIPITLARYFGGGRPAQPPAEEPGDSLAPVAEEPAGPPADTTPAAAATPRDTTPRAGAIPADTLRGEAAPGDTARAERARADTTRADTARAAAPARQQPRAAAAPAPKPGPTVRIKIKNMQYARRTIEIPAGATVVWENDDPLPHTVTSDRKGGFDSRDIASGKTWSRSFTRPGTYAYHCTPHPFMTGTVVVK